MNGRVAAVLGVGPGLGSSVARRFASEGFAVASDGSASEPQETRAGSRMLVYCALCDGLHPRPDKRRGEMLQDVHRRAVAP